MSRTVKTRTFFTTLLGGVTLLVGGLGSIFSLFALLLALGKPYANAFDPLGIFLIFILPPVTLLAGVGLLLRQRWARWWMILLMVGLVALGVQGLVAPTHEIPAYAPVPGPAADGLRETVIVQSITSITVGILVLIGLFLPRTRSEFSSAKSNVAVHNAKAESWRVGRHNRDLLNYEQIGTIPRTAASVVAPSATAIPSKSDGTILPAFIFLICVTVACLWFVSQGVKTNEIRLPARGSGNQRVVRAEKPALFWTSIGLLGIIGATSTGTAIWLLIHRIQSASQSPKP